MDGTDPSSSEEVSSHMVGMEKVGSPKDAMDPYVCQMKAAKQCLRKEQRREAARIRTQKVENIMNAENNSNTFFKLIKDQRKSSNPQTETLIVEN